MPHQQCLAMLGMVWLRPNIRRMCRIHIAKLSSPSATASRFSFLNGHERMACCQSSPASLPTKPHH